jgi:hypothetical protein
MTRISEGVFVQHHGKQDRPSSSTSTSASIPRLAKASRAPHATGHGCGWAGVVCNCCQNSTPRLKFDAREALPTNNSVSRGSGTHNWAAGHERATDCAIDWSGPWRSAHLRHDIGRPGFSLLAHHGPRHLRHYASADVTHQALRTASSDMAEYFVQPGLCAGRGVDFV